MTNLRWAALLMACTLTLAMEEPCHAWIQPLAEDLLQQVPTSRLAGFAEAMTLSGMLKPDVIISRRAESVAAPFIGKGLIAAAWKYRGIWNEHPAMHLRLAAERLGAKEISSELEQLTKSFKSGRFGRPVSLNEPSEPPASYQLPSPVDSVLESQTGFDKVQPQQPKPPPPPRWLIATAVSLFLLLPLYTWRKYRRYATRPNRGPASGRSR